MGKGKKTEKKKAGKPAAEKPSTTTTNETKKAAQKQKEPKVKAPKQAKIIQVDPARAAHVKEEILRLDKQTDQGYLALAELLYEAESSNYAATWGESDFESFCEKLSVGKRKAYYMISIAKALHRAEGAISHEDLDRMGWCKAREIAPVLTAETAEKWVKAADELTVKQLSEAVKASKPGAKVHTKREQETKSWALTFKLDEIGNSQVMDAVKQSKAILGNDHDGDAIAHVCMEWLQYKGESPTFMPLSQAIQWVERTYGVEISYRVAGDASSEFSSSPNPDELPPPEVVTSIKDLLGVAQG